ncbi:hypothetical protein RchiOBHm_Chr4g0416081 [Rosa chinensis]|uniref:Uncharacterized protein n=1 Tax=Rosa chinensis TaxID=74649 RepID=A0A2P6QWQ8_ROSCH|nr:hypothetical protein RchiOBHm_Chr4g0416081 [Rosa chinensis]
MAALKASRKATAAATPANSTKAAAAATISKSTKAATAAATSTSATTRPPTSSKATKGQSPTPCRSSQRIRQNSKQGGK